VGDKPYRYRVLQTAGASSDTSSVMVLTHLARVVLAGLAAIAALLASAWYGRYIRDHRRVPGALVGGPRFLPGEPALIDLGFDEGWSR